MRFASRPAISGLMAAVLMLGVGQFAAAQEHDGSGKTEADQKKDEVDSEHIFGFSEGSDVGDRGEKELEAEPLARLGKRSGTYVVTSTELLFKYTIFDNFRIAPMVSVSSHDINNVPGFQDVNRFGLEDVGFEVRYRLLDREHAPFGLTLSAAPHRNWVDQTTGVPVQQYGIEFSALIDKELIPDRLFGAVNLLYEPEWTKLKATGEQERDSTLGVAASLSVRVMPNVFVNAEARYMWQFQGALPNVLVGQALFFGPGIMVRLPDEWFISAAWNAQVAGHAMGDPLALDLTNFERHQAKVRIGKSF